MDRQMEGQELRQTDGQADRGKDRHKDRVMKESAFFN